MGNTNWSKVGKRAKRKGKTYERRCAKLLTDFTGINFRPTPASGGFNKRGLVIREEMFCGDLICDNPAFRYGVEAKNREEFSFTSMIKSPHTAAFTTWWYQCVDDASRVGLKPLMFFKPNIRDDFVVMTKADWDTTFGNSNVPYFIINAYTNSFKLKVDKEEIEVKLPTPVIIDWKLFIKHHDPKLMFKAE